jgi:uncharacterized membrane protein YdjX (TVP38/TMEM64 family)
LKRINPIFLFIGFNILLFLFRDSIFPDYSNADLSSDMEAFLDSLGIFGYLGVLTIYAVCSFFFIPLLIPLNIACGALYGAYIGTAISIVGIVAGCLMSTVSVRYVFTGMQRLAEERPAARKVLEQISTHGVKTVILVRLAFIVPYLLQNIVLAATTVGAWRLAALTAIGSLPGAAIYSFLGAGLVQSDDANDLALYLGIPLALFVVISLVVRYVNKRYDAEQPP